MECRDSQERVKDHRRGQVLRTYPKGELPWWDTHLLSQDISHLWRAMGPSYRESQLRDSLGCFREPGNLQYLDENGLLLK